MLHPALTRSRRFVITPFVRGGLKFRLLFLLASGCVLAALLMAGCCCRTTSYVGPLAVYSRVTTSDFEGRCIAEYIAEGPVEEMRGGFTFRAVERRIFQPCPLTFRYPLGRPVRALASNIVVDPASRPVWLIPEVCSE